MRKARFTTPPASNHPQYAMHALLARFGIKRRDVEILGRPAQGGREVLASEAMRPSNATAEWHDRLKRLDIAAQIAAGMDKLAVIEARQSGDGGARDCGRDARGAASRQIGGAGDAGPRAGAAGDGGARPLESRIQRFRRRRADGNAGRDLCAAGGGSRDQGTGAADPAGAAQASAAPARRRAWRAEARHRSAGAGAAARHAAASGQQRARRATSPAFARNCASCAAAKRRSLHHAEPRSAAARPRPRSGAAR